MVCVVVSEAYPADSLDLDAFWNGGAEAVDFHDIPVVDRPCYVEMKQFIDNEGQFLHLPRRHSAHERGGYNETENEKRQQSSGA